MKISGLLKTLTLYWFSIIKRKICRSLDIWKKAQISIRCLSPELSLWKHPLCGHLDVVGGVCSLSVGGSPSALSPLLLFWKTPFTPAAVRCARSCAALAWEKEHISLPCLWPWARLWCHSSAAPLGLVQLSGSEHTLQPNTGSTLHNTHTCLGLFFYT